MRQPKLAEPPPLPTLKRSVSEPNAPGSADAGAIRPKQLDYLAEFTFRFNRRTSRHRGLVFYRLLEQAIQIDRVPIRELVGGRPSPIGA